MKIKFTKGKVLCAIAISLTVLFANYFAGNTSIPLPDEMSILKKWDKVKLFIGTHTDTIPDDVLLVNVGYDKMLVDYYYNNDIKDSVLEGQQAITDRKKLLDFLTIAKEADNYKYIFLDVLFEKGLESDYDSLLFNTISGMDRIVIPVHEGVELQDSCLYAKAANSDYTTTWEETDFARYQFIHQGVKSAPLRMYEDINKGGIVQKGLFFFSSDGILCRNGVTLKMPVTISENTRVEEEEEERERYIVYNLGADLLNIDSISPIADELDGKIVIIGDFVNDIHVTYAGKQPGSVICLNAYYSLVHGDHIVFGNRISTFIFYLFVALLYFGLSIIYLNGLSVAAFFDNAWLKVACSIVSVSILFWLIAAMAYIAFDIVYNIWIPAGIFTMLDFIVSIFNSYKNEKK